MRRVRHNVELIWPRIAASGYEFLCPDEVFVPAAPRDLEMIGEIEATIGPLPLSFRAFHEVVGSVDFRQSFKQIASLAEERRSQRMELGTSTIEILGEEDPLVVRPISSLYHDVVTNAATSKDNFGPGVRYSWREGGEGLWYYCFADDECHKANYSGGENYNLFVPDPCADFRIRDLFLGKFATEEEDREWFVDYLRNTFRGGGFRGGYRGAGMILHKRIPRSPLIEGFREGLLRI